MSIFLFLNMEIEGATYQSLLFWFGDTNTSIGTTEDVLEAVILRGGAEEDIEFAILDNILIDRDEEGQGPAFDLENLSDEEVAIHAKEAAIKNCWEFIDRTARAMCLPSVNQEDYYSEHKRLHSLKYQSVLCPDGIISSLLGGFPGRRHDAGIFRESNLYHQLEGKVVFGENNKFILFGDQEYGLRELFITPFPGQANQLTPAQLQFNQSMKTLRVAVEWRFSKDLQSLYKVSILLTNAHTCLYGIHTADYFNLVPPNLEEYFGE